MCILAGSVPHTFYFGVKFYAADPCKLFEEITRYLIDDFIIVICANLNTSFCYKSLCSQTFIL